MRNYFKQNIRFALVLVAAVCLLGCGGGGEGGIGESGVGEGGGGVSPTSGIMMSWTPPDSYADQTPLDPETDLEEYEIYMNQTGSFEPDEVPVAFVAAVDPISGIATSAFDLANLGASLAVGKTYYICMRSVTTSGTKSGYSPILSFTI